ncbi:MAG TPA: ATP-binding protein [Steroidobacteraceae bacterium]|nr:ATP-binding protein [Steroidobacteraceae bacterium]
MTPSVPAITALASNAAILLALLALSELLPRRRHRTGRFVAIGVGLVLGGLAVALMASAYSPAPGVIVDSRGVLISTAGLFFGAIPTVTAMLVAAGYRLHMGGAGAWYGVAALLAAGAAGLLWRQARRNSLARIGGVELLGLGLLVHAATVIALLLAPPTVDLGGLLVSVLVVMPLATVVVGQLLVRQLRRREVVQALRESESRYRALFADNHASMLLVRPYDNRIVGANAAAARFYGWSTGQLVSMRIEDLDADPGAAGRPGLSLPAMTGGDDLVHRHRLADGSLRDVEISSAPIMVGGAQLLYAIVRDVTERVATERELREAQAQSDRLRMEAERSRDELMHAVAQRYEAEEALRGLNAELEQRVAERTRDLAVARDEAEASNRVKNMFLATMSHELRTPLNSIIGFSDLLLHGLAGPLAGEQRTQIEIINRSGRTLLAVISDLLDVSKIEAGKLVLELQRVSLAQLVEQQWQSAAIQAEARHLTLQLPEGPAGVVVSADPQRLRQVLGNLLSNAIKYTDHGSITGGWRVDGTRATVWIRDTGVGIPDEHRALLFRPFHRVEGARSRTREGTGLGLAICDRLVREMGGEIGYESTIGVGSTFWFSLPLAPVEPTGTPRVTAGTAA